jgi:hypothetical protein
MESKNLSKKSIKGVKKSQPVMMNKTTVAAEAARMAMLLLLLQLPPPPPSTMSRTESLIVTQLVKKIPAFYGTHKYSTVFTAAHHLTPS